MSSIPTNLKLLLVAIIVMVVLGGGFYLKNKHTNKSAITKDPTSVVTPTIAPTITHRTSPAASTSAKTTTTASNVFKFGFKKGPYSPYKITLEPGWKALPGSQNSDSRSGATITKGEYSISLTEDLSQMTGKCRYPGEKSAGTDRAFASFAEIKAGTNTFRRGLTTISSPSQTVCQKQVSGYEFPTQFGYMLYSFPTGNIDADTIIEMDKMLSSIRPTE